MTKVVGLLCVALATLSAPGALEAQGFIARANTSRTVWVEFGRGGPSQNGYESARVPVEYHVYACRGISPGAVIIQFGLRPDGATSSRAYWYEGEKYEAAGRPTVRSALVDARATSPGGEVGSMQREARPASSLPADCENGGVNFTNLGPVSPFADPTKPAAVAQFLNTVTLSAQAMSEPLRDYNLEQELAQQRRAAEQAAAEQARAERESKERAEAEAKLRQAAETRAAAEAQGAQTQAPAGSTAGSQPGGSAEAQPVTPEQAAAAEQAAEQAAARQEEARRAVEQAQEEARRQQEQQEEMTAAAVEVAGMAARSGGAFGGYYFTGGDPSSSLYKFAELSGMGMGFNFGPMIMDLGQLKGTYSEFFVEDYAEENGGSLPESGEVDGMFLHVGLQYQKTFDALRLGMSGGYMYAYTDEAEISSPTMGFIIGYSMLKFRFDAGLGDESTAGYALYLQF
ncbi:MAG TPA: hypothetical protein VHG09_10570 [Longimicrobiales bacterium]|nr:hypothetical protein [Longimicrobiales bacterium]